MPLPKEVLESVAADISKASASLKELKEVVTDMRLSGMETTKQDDEVNRLSEKLRTFKVFYERQKAKAG